jgi:hypothetical protein
MSRCQDDPLFGWLLFLLAFTIDPPRSCCDDNRRDDRFRDDEYRVQSPARPSARHTWRRPLAWGVAAASILTAAIVWPRTPSSEMAVAPMPASAAAEPRLDVAVSGEMRSEAIPASVSAPVEIHAGVDALPDATAIEPLDPAPLPSRTLVAAADLSATNTFGIGASRDDVLAVQGQPTYAKGDTLWWGSSKVRFSKSGFVESWTDGLPPLHTR